MGLCPSARRPRKTLFQAGPSVRKDFKSPTLIGFTTSEQDKIKEVLRYAFDREECTKAFLDAGLTPIGKQLDAGIIYVHSKTLVDKSKDKLWELEESGLADALRDAYKGPKASVADYSLPGPYRGKHYSVFTSSALMEE